MPDQFLLRGGSVLDTATGERARGDVGVRDGLVVDPGDLTDAREIDVTGLTVMWGLWDSHAHPGGLMYDPSAEGYFEGVAARTIRAGTNLQEAASMGVTGVRAVGDGSGVDLAWARAFRKGETSGPRLIAAGRSIRTTGGHGTAYPRRFVDVETGIIADGAVEMRRAVRTLVEEGADWIKILITGGLYSEHESVAGKQFDDSELEAALAAAHDRGVPVAAHCGSARQAEQFANLGGRSVEHGYALDEAAAATMAERGTWLIPTIGVTHDRQMMIDTGWPPHAAERALQSAAGHAESLRICMVAGVRIATGADLNPIGPRLHRELELLHEVGMTLQQVLYAATTSARALVGLGESSAPVPGGVADLILLDDDPMEGLATLRKPRGIMTFGRFVIEPN